MKKFQFRLETVLKIRTIELEHQAKFFALAQQIVSKARMEIIEIRRLQDEEVVRVKDLTTRGLFTQQMFNLSVQFRNAMKQKEKVKTKELSELMAKAERERVKLVEKEKNKKVLDKLKERDLENHEETYKKQETKEMDELASTRWWAPER